MSRLLLLLSLTLGVLAVVHLAGTAVAALLLPAVRGRRSPAERARLALGLRVAPLASAASLAFLVSLSFVRLEPPDTGEHAGPLLLVAGAMGAWLVLVGGWRATRSLLLTRRLVRDWLSGARPLSLLGTPAPAHRIENSFPVVAVAGVLRPRLFLAGSVLDRLTFSELRAVIDHERAHLDRRDNLKRWLLHSCPDLPLLGGPGEGLRREWEEASEVAADDVAACRGREAAESLASALVKVARITPRGARLSVSATALLSEDGLRGRVERLLSPNRGTASSRQSRGLWWLAAVFVALAAPAVPGFLLAVHRLLETIVRSLS